MQKRLNPRDSIEKLVRIVVPKIKTIIFFGKFYKILLEESRGCEVLMDFFIYLGGKGLTILVYENGLPVGRDRCRLG